MTMQYDILPASAEDAVAWRSCVDRAYANSLMTTIIFPQSRAHLSTDAEFQAQKVGSQRKRMSDPNGIFLKTLAADQPGVIVGYTGLFKPGKFAKKATTTSDGQQRQQLPATPELQHAQDAAAAMPRLDPEPFDEYTRKSEQARAEIWGDDSNYYFLGALGVDPSHQHRGLARRMMQIHLDRADSDGLPIFLETSLHVAPFYRRMGFESRNEFSIAGGRYTVVPMVRPPRGVR
ncbi:hypothetical protein LTR53_007802 [Teratosphaeriaceae sp. CCFEE 6253]|nr:hypothetical protein LTR53_007802 [Teratosphaeriaceae sp. CCFEE 6253]